MAPSSYTAKKWGREHTPVPLASEMFRLDPFAILRHKHSQMPEGDEKEQRSNALKAYTRGYWSKIEMVAAYIQRALGVTLFPQSLMVWKCAVQQDGLTFAPLGKIPDEVLENQLKEYAKVGVHPRGLSTAHNIPKEMPVDMVLVGITKRTNIGANGPIKPQLVEIYAVPLDLVDAITSGIWADDLIVNGEMIAAATDRKRVGLRTRVNMRFSVIPNATGGYRYKGRHPDFQKWVFTRSIPQNTSGEPMENVDLPAELTLELPGLFEAKVESGRGPWTDEDVARPAVIESEFRKAATDRTGYQPGTFPGVGVTVDAYAFLGLKRGTALTNDVVMERASQLELDEKGNAKDPRALNTAWNHIASLWRAEGRPFDHTGMRQILSRNHEDLVTMAADVLLEEVAAAKAKAEADAAEAAKKAAEGGGSNPPNGSENGKNGSAATAASQPEGGVADPPTQDGVAT